MFQLETISAKMLDYYVGRRDSLIIDLRSGQEYAQGHVRGAISLPYESLEEYPDYDKGKILVFCCDRGGASLVVAKQYAGLGYKVRSVIGGMEAYHGRNLVISG